MHIQWLNREIRRALDSFGKGVKKRMKDRYYGVAPFNALRLAIDRKKDSSVVSPACLKPLPIQVPERIKKICGGELDPVFIVDILAVRQCW